MTGLLLSRFATLGRVLRPLEYVGGTTTNFLGGTGTGTVSLTGLTGGLASAPAAGDYVVVAYSIGTDGRTPTLTITGNNFGAYSQLTGSPVQSNDIYDARLAVFGAVMGATPDTQLTRSGTGNLSDGGSIIVHVWRGINLTTQMDVTPTTATGSNTYRANPPAITPVTAGAYVLVIAAGAASSCSTAWTTSGLSNVLQDRSNDDNDSRTLIGSVAWTSGAVDIAQFTGPADLNEDSWACMTIALRPET